MKEETSGRTEGNMKGKAKIMQRRRENIKKKAESVRKESRKGVEEIMV